MKEMEPAETEEPSSTAPVYEFGTFRLDPARRLLLRSGGTVPLTPKAFDTLVLLVENRHRLVNKDEMMSRIWPDTFVEEGSLTRNISVLRKTLGENPREHQYIVTIPGQGYQFVAEVIESDEQRLTVIERTRTNILVEDEMVGENDYVDVPAVSAGTMELPTPTAVALLKGEVRPDRRGWVVLGAAGLIILLSVLGYWLVGARWRDRDASPGRLEFTQVTHTGNVVRGAISGDGRYIVYSLADSPRTNSVWVRQLATQATTQLIPSTEGEFNALNFSKDGSYVYYVVGPANDLHRIPLLGGPSTKLLSGIEGPVSFSPDSSRMAFRRDYPERRVRALMVANSDGTSEQEVASISYPESFGTPSWSPRGDLIACGAGYAGGPAGRYVLAVNLADRTVREISGRRWRWIGDVEWLADARGLLMIAADVPTTQYQVWYLSFPGGEARRITNTPTNHARLSVTADSKTALAVQVKRATNVWVIDRDDPARARRVTFGSGGFLGPVSWTTDGQLVHGAASTGVSDISIMDSDGKNARSLLGDLATQSLFISPEVSPDGRYIAFASEIAGARNIWRMNADGSDHVRLTHGEGEHVPTFTPDGKWLIYADIASEVPTLWKVGVDGGHPVQLTRVSSTGPAVSPDGRMIACFYADETLESSRRLAIFPIEGGKPIRVFPQPLRVMAGLKFTRDGRALTYADDVDGSFNIWLQPIEGGAPTQLTYFSGERIFGFDWSRDGKHLACVRGIWETNLVLIDNLRQASQ